MAGDIVSTVTADLSPLFSTGVRATRKQLRDLVTEFGKQGPSIYANIGRTDDKMYANQYSGIGPPEPGSSLLVVWTLKKIKLDLLNMLRRYGTKAKKLMLEPTKNWRGGSPQIQSGLGAGKGKVSLGNMGTKIIVSGAYIVVPPGKPGDPVSQEQKYAWVNDGTDYRIPKSTGTFRKGDIPSTKVGSLSSGVSNRAKSWHTMSPKEFENTSIEQVVGDTTGRPFISYSSKATRSTVGNASRVIARDFTGQVSKILVAEMRIESAKIIQRNIAEFRRRNKRKFVKIGEAVDKEKPVISVGPNLGVGAKSGKEQRYGSMAEYLARVAADKLKNAPNPTTSVKPTTISKWDPGRIR